MRLRTVAPAATIALAAAALLLAGCKKTDSNANGANTRNTTVTSTNTATTTGAATPLGTPTSTVAAASPTEAFRLYYEAIKRNDVPAIKALFSRATINMLEEQAKRSNKSFDDVFNEGLKEASEEIPASLPESRNEKVNGDRATLEINDAKKGSWDTVHFVKEGGWKISFASEDRAGGDDDSGGGDGEGEKEGGGDHGGH